MAKENQFGINAARVTQIGIGIREANPDYIWGDSEFRNAIFEDLVIKFGLPWNNQIGCPDFDDERVKKLANAVQDVLRNENETEHINGIIGQCEIKDCGWETSGRAKINRTDRVLEECDLTQKCLKHHTGTGQMTKHNRFVLFYNNEQVGIASVSTQACTGYIKPL